MQSASLSLCGIALQARPAGTLWWPDAGLLAVSDLHLGKSGRIARRSSHLLPPYETADTLERLSAEITALNPGIVICLGDSFDDMASAGALDGGAREHIAGLMQRRDWVWITGNHDPAPAGLGGTPAGEYRHGPLCFRHIADATADPGEISGHYHPKLGLPGTSRRRPCFLADTRRIILPAFGTYTGGLACSDNALDSLMEPGALAVLTGPRALRVPMRAPASMRRRAG